MSSLIIACYTLEDEVNLVNKETGVDYPVIWIESGLHAYPDKLRDAIQDQIDKIANVEQLILVFGNCGNALTGIRSENAKIVIPRVDDCITLLLGSLAKRMELTAEAATYFFTRGWIINEMNIIKEYEHCIEKYGSKKAERIMKVILKNYKRLMLIDTGAYPMDDDCLVKPKEMAAKFALEYQIETGTLDFLRRLITGPWDEDFIMLPPGTPLSLNDFGINIGAGSQIAQTGSSRE